ncbi:MAG: hypothetical protein OXH33_03145 [bacterium]|nr:hypothetical protein [bacterium]
MWQRTPIGIADSDCNGRSYGGVYNNVRTGRYGGVYYDVCAG